MLNGVAIVKSQPTNPSRGDGFWTQVSTMRMEQIIWSNDTLYAARGPWSYTNGGAYRSIDGGVSWDTLFSVPWGSANGVRIFIHPIDKKILYIISGALYKSTNYGQSWAVIFNSTTLVRLGINPNNPLIMYVTKTVPFGSVYKTTNGGTSWFEIRNGLPINVYFAAGPIDINPDNPEIVLLGTNAGLYRSANGGLNWDTTIVRGFIPGVNIHPLLPNLAFASTTYDWATYKTTNFGESWYKTIGSDGEFNRRTVFHKINANILYNTENMKSIDTGNTWIKLDSLNNSWVDIDLNSSLIPTLFATSGSYGFYTYNDISTDILDNNEDLERILCQNYPNPFNSTTTIQLTIPEQKEISIQIYDILGRLIRTVLNNSFIEQGQHRYYWDGKNDTGNTVSTGIYFSKIFINQNNSSEVKSLKLILLK